MNDHRFNIYIVYMFIIDVGMSFELKTIKKFEF